MTLINYRLLILSEQLPAHFILYTMYTFEYRSLFAPRNVSVSDYQLDCDRYATVGVSGREFSERKGVRLRAYELNAIRIKVTFNPQNDNVYRSMFSPIPLAFQYYYSYIIAAYVEQSYFYSDLLFWFDDGLRDIFTTCSQNNLNG